MTSSKHNANRARALSAVALFVAGTLAGCAVGPNYHQPKTPVAPTYGAAEPAVYTSENAQVQFWKQFNDETLDKLVDDALNANHDLRIAVGRLAEARAARHQSLYDLAPTVTPHRSCLRFNQASPSPPHITTPGLMQPGSSTCSAGSGAKTKPRRINSRAPRQTSTTPRCQ